MHICMFANYQMAKMYFLYSVLIMSRFTLCVTDTLDYSIIAVTTNQNDIYFDISLLAQIHIKCNATND